MAALTSKQRETLDDSDFCGKDRSFPAQNRTHAANAKARALQQLKLGHITHPEYMSIVDCANTKLEDFKSGKLKEKH